MLLSIPEGGQLACYDQCLEVNMNFYLVGTLSRQRKL